MRRTAFAAAAITVALSAPMALPATARSTDVERVSGTVVELVRETHAVSRGADPHELVLATAEGFVPLSDGARPRPGERVTAEIGSDGAAVPVSRTAVRAVEVAADIERKVYVGIVAPAGYALGDNKNTIESVRGSLERASSYWASQTGGTIRFSLGGSLPKYVSDYRCGDTAKMWNEAIERFADAGTDVTGVGKYLLLVGPTGSSEDGCDYGLGTLGALDSAWNATFVSDTSQSLYAHELGHNLGLAHANALRCNGVQDGIWNGTDFGGECSRWRYEDLLDVMGYSGERYGEGNLNAPHVHDLALDPAAITSVTGPATVTIPPLSTMAPGRGLEVTDTNGVTYYVEYRTATGRDAVAALNSYRPSLGVLLYREDPAAYRGHGSYHLDATPGRSDDYDYDRALRPGATFRSAAGTLTITTVSQDATGAVVAIAGGAGEQQPPGEPTAARVVLTGPSTARRDGRVTLTATVRSATNAAVPGVKVTFQRLLDGAWVDVATATTSSTGVAKTVVKLRRATKFRAGVGETFSSRTAVRAWKRAKQR